MNRHDWRDDKKFPPVEAFRGYGWMLQYLRLVEPGREHAKRGPGGVIFPPRKTRLADLVLEPHQVAVVLDRRFTIRAQLDALLEVLRMDQREAGYQPKSYKLGEDTGLPHAVDARRALRVLCGKAEGVTDERLAAAVHHRESFGKLGGPSDQAVAQVVYPDAADGARQVRRDRCTGERLLQEALHPSLSPADIFLA